MLDAVSSPRVVLKKPGRHARSHAVSRQTEKGNRKRLYELEMATFEIPAIANWRHLPVRIMRAGAGQTS
jgi:hypothetical protein